LKYSDLKENLKEIVELVQTVPEKLQQTCFEILLQSLLAQSKAADIPPTPKPEKPAEFPGARSTTVPLNTELRVFMRKRDVTEEQLNTVVFFEAGQVHFVKEPSVDKIATAQIEWSLLLALKNAILGKSFTVDPEDVRSICQAKGVYDIANFAAVFKQKANARLFKGEMKSQGEPSELSDDGLAQLAKLVCELSA